jgi:hypothetical protein
MRAGHAMTRPAVLIVTMGTDYVAPARMPHELRRAGFEVAMLAPRESLAAHTAFVNRIGFFPEQVSLGDWIQALAAMIRAVGPELILPGDDVTVRLLMQIVLAPPEGLNPAIRREIDGVIRRSLGPPGLWMDTVDKTRLFEAARRIGVPVAEGGVAAGGEEANADDVAYAVQRLRPAMGNRETGPARFLVQRWIDGPVVTRAALAWNGREIAGSTRGRLETHPAPFGPASVVEYLGLPAVARSSDTLCATLALHGFIGLQFIVDPADGRACLVEIKRRMLPATHGGAGVGIDLAAALFAMVTGSEWTGPRDLPEGPGRRLALFPQEWLRDPASRWLQTLPTDAPWHDPGLFVAMMKARLA